MTWKCEGCKKEIELGEETETFKDKTWHVKCKEEAKEKNTKGMVVIPLVNNIENMVHKKKKCMGCGKFFRKLHKYEGKFLCYFCYRKNFKMIYSPTLYEEPLDQKLQICVSITKSQKEQLNKRMTELYGTKERCRSKYMRLLIFNDLLSVEENENGQT